MAGSVILTTINTRDYFVEQLRLKNQDNASSLALSLTQAGLNTAGAALIVSAQFDNGNYELIRFSDAQGNTVVEKKSVEIIDDVPAWFVRLIPIQVTPGVAKITNGWRQLGTVTLVSHSEYAYQSLWKSMLRISLVMIATTLIGCGLGLLVLQRVMRSLNNVVNQANLITQKRFITIEEPKEPELKKVVSAMNFTVSRLKAMFEEEAARLNVLRREVNFDSVTGMLNRGSFMTRLKEVLHTEESAFGTCMILRVSNLGEVNKNKGHLVTNAILCKISTIILRHSDAMPEALCGRLNGSDFGMLIQSESPRKSAEALLNEIVSAVGAEFENGHVASIGMSQYYKGMQLSMLLTNIDNALASANATPSNSVAVMEDYTDHETPRTIEAWSKILQDAEENELICLLSFPVSDFDNNILHQEGPIRIRTNPDKPWIPAGKFLPVAERLGIVSNLDLLAVKLGIHAINSTAQHPGYSISISPGSLLSDLFTSQVRQLIIGHPDTAEKLYLEFSEAVVYKHYSEFKTFCLDLKESKVRIGVKHYGREFDGIHRLNELDVHFIKIDASYVRDLDKNSGNQAFLRGLSMIAHGIGLQVYAEGVLNESEYSALKDAGFDGVAGPIVKIR